MDKSRYIRQTGIFGADGQQILANTKVLCIGAGGLGTLVSSFLIAAGIRHIGLMDKDIIELSNLTRQLSYTEKDCGQSKVQVLKNYLQQRNSSCQIDLYDYHLQYSNTRNVIEEYDLILDCTDNFPTKYLISDLCCINNKPLISASVDGFQGQILTLMPDMCYRCIFPAATNTTSCSNNDVIGPAIGVIASIQANEAIKLIIGLNHENQLTQIDTLDNTMNKFILCTDQTCINNHQNELYTRYESNIRFIHWKDIQTLAAEDQVVIVDIRKDQTNSIITNAIKSSYENIIGLNLAKDKNIIIVCNFGQRSKLAALKLATKGYQKILYSKLTI